MDPLSLQIGQRMAYARGTSVSQEMLAAALGFKDRQTVSAIELGERKLNSEELIRAADFFGKPLEFFTDPYMVPEKSTFSYRARTLETGKLRSFEEQAERLISAQRRFRNLLGESTSPVHPQLPGFTKSTPLSLATLRGEQAAAAWNLGEAPAHGLRAVVEDKLNISVFYVDAPDGISGAACYLSDGGVVLVNRRETLGRRNFDLGHEVFHLLTWNEMPPERMDYFSTGGRAISRTEQLADAFTAGLLMPGWSIRSRWEGRGSASLDGWLKQNAEDLAVSRIALYWRLVNLELTEKGPPPPVTVGGKPLRRDQLPELYNAAFVGLLHRVLAEGHVTVIKATELLDCSVEGLAEIFRSHTLPVPFA